MPGYIIHLAEAKLITDSLEKMMPSIELTSTWREEFYYGTLLPDAAQKGQKSNSHFWNKKDVQYVTMVPDLESFCKKYERKDANAVYWGYFVHLQLDNLFWKKFMRKNIEFLDCEGHYTELLKEVTDVKLKKKGAVISLKKFFSEEYLYGDYTKLNETFIRNYDLVVPKYKADIEKVIEEADYEGMKTVLDKLKKFISEKKV